MKYLLFASLFAYQKGIAAGDFYEEPIGDDFIYPDWQWILLIITPDYLL